METNNKLPFEDFQKLMANQIEKVNKMKDEAVHLAAKLKDIAEGKKKSLKDNPEAEAQMTLGSVVVVTFKTKEQAEAFYNNL